MKNVMPLAWHKQCLVNQSATLAHRETYLLRVQSEVEGLRARVEFAKQQIAEAERQGMVEFDSERFLKPRKASSAAQKSFALRSAAQKSFALRSAPQKSFAEEVPSGPHTVPTVTDR